MKNGLTVVTGRGDSSAGRWLPICAGADSPRFARSTSSRSTSGTRCSTTSRTWSLDLNLKDNCDAVASGASHDLQPRRRHGRHGLHREQQGPVHAQRADQHAHAGGGTEAGVERFFYASSACVYNADKQKDVNSPGAEGRGRLPRDARRRLRLGEALQRAHVPALPRGLRHVDTRVARFHNVYGPHGTWDGGREKAPAAICRKVIEAKLSGQARNRNLGRRQQTRSFMYIDDCLQGHPADHGQRHPRADQPRLERTGDDQPAGRHRRGHRRRQAQAQLQPRARPRASTAATATTR